MSINAKFYSIFEAARYLQAQEGESTTALVTLSRTLGLSVAEITETVESVGDTLVGLVGVGREIALFFRVN